VNVIARNINDDIVYPETLHANYVHLKACKQVQHSPYGEGDARSTNNTGYCMFDYIYSER